MTAMSTTSSSSPSQPAVAPCAGGSATYELPIVALARAASLAPSPDNNQPWRFEFFGDRLLIHEDVSRRLPSDVCGMFSLLALGAATENAVIEAGQHDLSASVRLAFGDSANEAPPAKVEVRFSPGGALDELASAIAARCTNRHGFSRQPIADPALERMSSAVERFEGCRATWVADRSLIRRLSKLVAVADRLRFEREEFHAELFRQLRFSAAEAHRTRDGLDLQTLGLPPGGGLLLKSLKSWPLVRTLNRLGLSRALTAPSASLVRKSGAIGIIAVDQACSESFFRAGRAFERLWLAAASSGLSLHPLGSLPIFIGRHELLGGCGLDERQQVLAASLAQSFRELAPALADRTLVMVFRIGLSGPPQVRSLRRTVGDVLA